MHPDWDEVSFIDEQLEWWEEEDEDPDEILKLYQHLHRSRDRKQKARLPRFKFHSEAPR